MRTALYMTLITAFLILGTNAARAFQKNVKDLQNSHMAKIEKAMQE